MVVRTYSAKHKPRKLTETGRHSSAKLRNEVLFIFIITHLYPSG
jgi:hypothetical protein